jgi:uncharacterized protein YfaS (alpha-2-macroglobulin family)
MKRLIVIALIPLIIVGCQPSDRLEIVSTNFDTNDHLIEMRQNLIFNFNQPVVADTALYTWDTTKYIKFSPDVKGVFKWNSPTELVFSPYEYFAPATEYTAELTERLLEGKAKSLTESRTLKFHTAAMYIESADIIWQRKPGTKKGIMNLVLSFPYEIKPSELKSKMTLRINGEIYEYEPKSALVASSITVAAETENPRKLEGETLEIEIAPGLRLADYNRESEETISHKKEIPSVDELRITNVKSASEDGANIIKIMTNQGIEKNQPLDSLITVKPGLDIEFEITDFGIEINGEFKTGETYEISVSARLRGVFGKTLGNRHTEYVTFGDIRPSISFSSSEAIYLTSRGNKNIGLNIRNIEKVKVSIIKIYENNIQAFFRRGQDYGWQYDKESQDYKQYRYYNYSNLGNQIYKKTYDVSSLPRKGNIHLLNMSMDLMEKFDGIYVVKAESPDHFWLQTSRIVSMSDIALIAKSSGIEVFAMANSIESAEPVSGAEIRLISTTNQLISKAKTNSNGIARFEGIGKDIPHFKPGMLAVKKGSDVNYMLLNHKSRVNTSSFETGGLSPGDYLAFFYGDRNLYRPGDTLVMAGIVRDRSIDNVSGLPVKLKVFLPGSKLYKTINTKTDDQGGFDEQLFLPENLVTGPYSIQAFLADDILLATRYVHVEEFVPDRIKVDLRLDKENYGIPGRIIAGIDAVNLFGPPAANRKYKLEFKLKQALFNPDGFGDYSFHIENDNNKKYLKKTDRESATNAEGKAEEKFNLPEKYKNKGYAKAILMAKVFDETGRTVSTAKEADVFTQDVFFGIGRFDRWVSTDSPLKIPLAAVDTKGNATKSEANIRIVKINWETVMRRNRHGGLRYESQKVERIITGKDIQIDGKRHYSFIPQFSGRYEVRVGIPESESYTSRSFYAYKWGSTTPASFKVDKEGKITIETDKEKYESGQSAKVLVKTPFDGKMLVTIERNKVFEYHTIETDNKAASLQIDLNDEYIPNVYISAVLYKAVDDGSMPLTVAYGFKSVSVSRQELKLPVEIIANDQVRSKTTQKIKIKSSPEKNINVTIAAVDEGILQISGFETPDPYGFFYQKRGLGMDSYTMYPFLFPELKAERQSYGSGGPADNMTLVKLGDGAKRINPMANKRIKLLAHWSGILKTNSRGEAEYSIDIPQFSGSVRIMACAYKDKAFGSAEKTMRVADPIVISAGLPRFLSPEDEAVMSVMLANTEKSRKSAHIAVKTSGHLEMVGNYKDDISIDGNSDKIIDFTVKAKKSTGYGKVAIYVKSEGETFKNITDIPVRAPVSLRKKSGSGEIAAGNSKMLNISHNFVPGSIDGSITVAATPIVNQLDNLDYLVKYPYGCIEQTISAAFPQLYFADLMEVLGRENSREHLSYSKEYITRAIAKIQAMQLPNGGVSFWLGGGKESWWGSAYAAHFLIEAERAGYYINQDMLGGMLDYLENRVGTGDRRKYYYKEDGKWHQREIAPREVFYSLYVLALKDRSDAGAMNYFRSRPELMSPDSKFMLAAAYKLAGDRRSFYKILPAKFSDARSKKQTGGSFASPVRDLGIALNTLIEADPKNKMIPQTARHLSQRLASERWLSTQERAWALLSLGKIAGRDASGRISADIFTNGKKIGSINKNRRIFSGSIDPDNTKINASGSGRAYYFWIAEGIPKELELKTTDNFIKVRRNFFDANGNPVTNNTFRQGDLIIVEVTLELLERNSTVENIAITDLLPAGLEVENPRIRKSKSLGWLKNQNRPEHFDYRDDRINIFTDFDGSGDDKRFYYLARAVTKGKFTMGQISAVAMYDGEYHSYSGGGSVTVK